MARQPKATRGTRRVRGERDFTEKFADERSAMIVEPKPMNEAQAIALQAFKDNQIIVLNGSAGTGKAQPLTSKLLTKNGWKNMGAVKVGDVIRGRTGWVTVTGVYPQGEKEVVEFEFADGALVQSCTEHLWTVNNGITKNGTRRIKKSETLQTSDIVDILNGRKSGNISVPYLNPVELEEIVLPVDPYVLGLLIGDGSLTTSTPHISTADSDVIDSVSKILGEDYLVSHVSNYDYSISYVNSTWKVPNELTRNLTELGLHGIKSIDKFIPDEYKFSSVEQRYNLVQGLMDSDGTVDVRNGNTTFCTVSQQLATDLVGVIRSLGGKASISTSEKFYTYKGEKKKGSTAYIVSINVPDKKKLFRLKRKVDKISDTDVKQLERNIVGYRYVGRVECQCIMVDSEDHLYVTDDYVLTHNTFLAATHAANVYLRDSRKTIYLSRPYVTMGRSAGLLPGTAEEKMAPFLAPLTGVLKNHLGKKYEADFGKNIQIQLIEAIRGLDLQDGILLVDEAQNLTIAEIKSIVTRIGKGSQIIFTGDSYQSDLKAGDSGLEWLCDIIEKYKINGADFVEFGPDDIVRSGLVKQFVQIFDAEGV